MFARLTILIVLLTGSLLGDYFSSRSLADERPFSTDDNGISADDDFGLFLLPKIGEPPEFDPLRAASLIEFTTPQDTEEVVPLESDKSDWEAAGKNSQHEAETAEWPEHLTVPNTTYLHHPSVPRNTDDITADLELGEEFDIKFDDYQWAWQLLPEGLLYKSYLAGTRESRISGALLHDTKDGWLLDATLGGRVGILRYGTPGGTTSAEGWQLDVEGAAFVRLNVERQWDVDSVDFRFGIPLTYRRGPWQWKAGYYHLSSHVGDEFLVRNPTFRRINYVRDSLFFGLGYYLTNDVRLYSEVGWALKTDGGADPFEIQFGADYSPAYDFGLRGAPYLAFNVHLREEVDFGGGINLMAGWQWRGPTSASTVRAGLQYYNGKSTQYAFFRQHEELLGFGVWYDY